MSVNTRSLAERVRCDVGDEARHKDIEDWLRQHHAVILSAATQFALSLTYRDGFTTLLPILMSVYCSIRRNEGEYKY